MEKEADKRREKNKVKKVAVVACKSYSQKEVDKAVRKVLKLLNFNLRSYKKILIKPNVLGRYEKNQEAITTHPSLVRAISKEFKGEKIIGESSFVNTENAFKKAGYSRFKNLIIFEQTKLIKIHDKKAKFLKNFYLPKILKHADLIINVPKLKTHALTKLTGAIKNLYGCIPGGMKQLLHKRAAGDKKFSKLLIDIYQNIMPHLNIMDAVVGMEGEGPSAGEPKKAGLIIASRNAVALDIVASKITGYKPKKIRAVNEAVRRGLANFKVEVVGLKLPKLNFKKPGKERATLIRAALRRFVGENPIVVNKEKCVKCRICEKRCPTKSINLRPWPKINKKTCIRCFCCIEVCPQHALYLKETLLRSFLRKIRRKRK
jgi:uncharacterized protein (DUF362 family)/ferredoxin